MVELRIGMDDTDSARGMCTTFLAHMMVNGLTERGCRFLDYPRLVRLNPNVPWKTRGNGAVALHVSTSDPAGVRRFVDSMVRRHSDMQNGANPGVTFLEGDGVPGELEKFAAEALHRVVDIRGALRLAAEAGVDVMQYGTGRGVVGAMAAVGYRFGDCTAEMLTYRRPPNVGTLRRIDAGSVKRMQEATYPETFSSYDPESGQVLAAPRGPDPVFYGIRGEDPAVLYEASKMIRHAERLAGHTIFRTNQGTGDHLAREIDPASPEPHSSGTAAGAVVAVSDVQRGGHVRLDVDCGGQDLTCWAYRPTGLAGVVRGLAPGDRVEVGGGVRPGLARLPPTLSLEVVRVRDLARQEALRPPKCGACGKNMKSRGRGQGYGCVRCGATAPGRVAVQLPRSVSRGEYVPRVSAHRHLARPAQRSGRLNGMDFSSNLPWHGDYSGE